MQSKVKYFIPATIGAVVLGGLGAWTAVGASPEIPAAAPHTVAVPAHTPAAVAPTTTPTTVAPAPAVAPTTQPIAALPAAPHVTTSAPATTGDPTPATVPAAPVTPAEPTQPPAADASGLPPGQCAIAVNSNQQNPVNGVWGVYEATYYGDCGQAQILANLYPGSILVHSPDASTDPGCSATGTCTSPDMNTNTASPAAPNATPALPSQWTTLPPGYVVGTTGRAGSLG